jgi:large subunit ribosomal protein L11
MSTEKISRRSKIQLVCGKAKPGANLAFLKKMAIFCREFNEKTKSRESQLVNVEITVFENGNYKWNELNTPSSYLIKEILAKKDEKTLNDEDLEEIVKKISSNLNTKEMEKAKKIVRGTARSFGIKF